MAGSPHDREKPAHPGSDAAPRSGRRVAVAMSMEAARERLQEERRAAIARLRELGISPVTDPTAPRADTETVLDEGDRAQASPRQGMAFATRARLAGRINRLTVAPERIAQGTYGTCRMCGGPIEPLRLAALPEADTCVRCQEELDRAA